MKVSVVAQMVLPERSLYRYLTPTKKGVLVIDPCTAERYPSTAESLASQRIGYLFCQHQLDKNLYNPGTQLRGRDRRVCNNVSLRDAA